MSGKVELHRKLKDIGYEVGPFASKETLANVMRLHSEAVETKDINVAKLSDLDLRKRLTESGLTVGPVTGHTRAIYQRKLLEILTNKISEGQDDLEVDEVISTTPPRTTRGSIIRNADANISSSPGRFYPNDMPEPRIPLTRVDIDEKHTRNLSSYYPTLPQTKPTFATSSQETITHSFSPQRAATKMDTRPNTTSYGLRNPYDFQNDEPVATRQEHKATPFRATNISSMDTLSTNINRYARGSELPTSGRGTLNAGSDLNEIRSRISTSVNEQKDAKLSKDTWAPKTSSQSDFEKKTSTDKDQQVVAAKSGGTLLYTGIAVSVALFVFILYLWLEQ